VFAVDSRASLLGALQGTPSDTLYELYIVDVGYAGQPDPEIAESCYFKFVPEPSSILIVTGVGALARQRRR
jgi:hypothetical protein